MAAKRPNNVFDVRTPTIQRFFALCQEFVPLVNGRILTRLIPNARLETIDDGHLFMVTRPDETAAIIEAFLAE